MTEPEKIVRPPVCSRVPPTVAGLYYFMRSAGDRTPIEVGRNAQGVLNGMGIGYPHLPLADWPSGMWYGPLESPV